MAIDIVDFPIKDGDFPVNTYQRVLFSWLDFMTIPFSGFLSCLTANLTQLGNPKGSFAVAKTMPYAIPQITVFIGEKHHFLQVGNIT